MRSRAETLRRLHNQFEAVADRGGVCVVNGAPGAGTALSGNIHDRIVRVLEGDALAQETVRYGACAGTVFDAQLVADALGESASKIGALLGSIERSMGIIQRQGRTKTFRFDH